MGWMDFDDVRKNRGSGPLFERGKKRKLSAEDAMRIAKHDPKYKSVDKKLRKAEKNRGENVKKRGFFS